MLPSAERTVSDCIKDLAVAALLGGVAIVALTQIDPGDAPDDMASGGVTFATLPLAAASGLLILTLIYAVGAARDLFILRSSGVRFGQGDGSIGWAVVVRRVATVPVLAGYVWSLHFLPLYVATPIFLLAMFWIYGERRPLLSIGIAVTGGAALHGLFVVLLNLPL